MLYPIAVFKGDEKTAHAIIFPDIENGATCCDELSDMLTMANEFIDLHFSGLAEDGEKIPLPQNFDKHLNNPKYQGCMWAWVDVDLSKYDITDKIKKWIYVISIVSFFIQVFATSFISSKVGIAQQFLYEASRPNVVIQAVAIFLFVKDLPLKINFSDRSKTIIGTVSKYSFGMYLVHDFFNLFFTKIGFTVMCMNPVVSILLRTIVTFILSFVVVWILDKIPLIRKHCI